MPKTLMKTVLVVEDNNELRDYLKKLLIDNDYATKVAGDGTSALKTIRSSPPDLVILDLGLPDISGETVCKEIKKDFQETQVIILTARSQSADAVASLNLGADDYMSKPFDGAELIARIKARFRSTGAQKEILQIADLVLNSDTFEVKRNKKLIPLTQKEFELLHYLMINKGRVLTREMILNKVWLYSPDIESRVVDVYVGYLRKKIDSGQKKKLIHSMRGFGYTVKE